MVNKVVLIGNLGRDPELIQTRSGQAVARLSVATNETWTNGGERKRRTEWHRIVAWGTRAESLASLLRKGSLVYIEGGFRTRPFTSGEKTGQTRTEIHARRVTVLRGGVNRGMASAVEPDGVPAGDDVPF